RRSGFVGAGGIAIDALFRWRLGKGDVVELLAAGDLCQACLTGKYPTPCGQQLYDIALAEAPTKEGVNRDAARTYEAAPPTA
ncbi:MAG: hypothetical protein AAGF31_13245, partial [Planctomycetota bacterium]